MTANFHVSGQGRANGDGSHHSCEEQALPIVHRLNAEVSKTSLR